MKLENQVTNLELSQKLQELGVKQKSLFWWKYTIQCESTFDLRVWRELSDKKKREYDKKVKWGKWEEAWVGGAWQPKLMTKEAKNDKGWISESKDAYVHTKLFFVSAFTVAELGEMLPEEYSTVKKFGKHRCFRMVKGNEDGEFMAQISDSDKNEANARAKMLIYLLENGLIKK